MTFLLIGIAVVGLVCLIYGLVKKEKIASIVRSAILAVAVLELLILSFIVIPAIP